MGEQSAQPHEEGTSDDHNAGAHQVPAATKIQAVQRGRNARRALGQQRGQRQQCGDQPWKQNSPNQTDTASAVENVRPIPLASSKLVLPPPPQVPNDRPVRPRAVMIEATQTQPATSEPVQFSPQIGTIDGVIEEPMRAQGQPDFVPTSLSPPPPPPAGAPGLGLSQARSSIRGKRRAIRSHTPQPSAPPPSASSRPRSPLPTRTSFTALNTATAVA